MCRIGDESCAGNRENRVSSPASRIRCCAAQCECELLPNLLREYKLEESEKVGNHLSGLSMGSSAHSDSRHNICFAFAQNRRHNVNDAGSIGQADGETLSAQWLKAEAIEIVVLSFESLNHMPAAKELRGQRVHAVL